MRKTHAAPSNLRLLKQCLLLGFFLVPVMAVGQAPDFGIKASVAATLLDENNVLAIQPNYDPLSKEALGERITDGTVYVACLG